MSRRYVVYFQPALVSLKGMGNRMATRLESQIADFLTAWRPKDAFEKKLQSHLWQFKWSPNHGSGARAFSGYFDGDHHDIALVLVTFKKTNESDFNPKQGVFNSRAKSFSEDTLQEKSRSEIEAWIDDQRRNDKRRVLNESDG